MKMDEMIYRKMIESCARAQPSAETEAAILAWCRDEYDSLTYPYVEMDGLTVGFRAPPQATDEQLIEIAGWIADIDQTVDDCGRWIVRPVSVGVIYVARVDHDGRLTTRKIGNTTRPELILNAAVAYIGKPAKMSAIMHRSTADATRNF